MATEIPNKESLEIRLKQYGQEHLLQFWDDLSDEEQISFAQEVRSIDFKKVNALSNKAITDLSNTLEKKDDLIQPLPNDIVGRISTSSQEEINEWYDTGLKEISEGKVAVLLLAGGQGTRLGVAYPKGMYNVGLPSEKTLYQLQAERIKKVQELANEKFGKSAAIQWYIMTSEATLRDTKMFFKKNNYFGLKSSNVTFFEQHLLPCLTFTGKLMLSSKCSIAQSPDGNGGLYRALKSGGILKAFEAEGIDHVFVYCVDNILVKVADPTFIGFCVKQGLDCGNKVIKKVDPHEAVGVVCKVEGKFEVVEYSEITPSTAEKRKMDGSLMFDASNICIHYLSTRFLLDFCNNHLDELPHHIAKKKIPHLNESGGLIIPMSPNGMKLEKFVFDVFPFSSKFGVFEGDRSEEFSPLKNGPDSAKCSPLHCKSDLLRLHRLYLEEAGAKFYDENGSAIGNESSQYEISPLLSYAGEGLQEFKSVKLDINEAKNLENLSKF